MLITTITVMILVTYEYYLLLCIGITRLQLHGIKSAFQRTSCLLVALTVDEYCQNILCLELQSKNDKTQSADSSVEGLWAIGNQDATGGQGGFLPYATFWSLLGMPGGNGCHISILPLTLQVVCSMSFWQTVKLFQKNPTPKWNQTPKPP